MGKILNLECINSEYLKLKNIKLISIIVFFVGVFTSFCSLITHKYDL